MCLLAGSTLKNYGIQIPASLIFDTGALGTNTSIGVEAQRNTDGDTPSMSTGTENNKPTFLLNGMDALMLYQEKKKPEFGGRFKL